MSSRVHAMAGLLGLTLITLFFGATVVAELRADAREIAMVKQLILAGVVVLIPTMMIVGGSGRSLAGKRGGAIIGGKRRRMVVIAAIGLLVLTPCAVILQHLSADGDFGVVFSLIQAIELLGGAVNIILMGLNVRAGLRLTGRVRPKKPV